MSVFVCVSLCICVCLCLCVVVSVCVNSSNDYPHLSRCLFFSKFWLLPFDRISLAL